jgi:hypothetical protein
MQTRPVYDAKQKLNDQQFRNVDMLFQIVAYKLAKIRELKR